VATDYYELLGVGRDATPDELKRSYRRLARELHPDTNPDPTAEDRFKEIGLAYEVLADPERRRRYDRFGPEGAARGTGGDPTAGFGGGLGDIFDAFFGGGGGGGFGGGGRGASGPPPGADMEMTVDVTFEEAVFGVAKEVTLRVPGRLRHLRRLRCRARHQPRSSCGECGGSGRCAGSASRSSGRWSRPARAPAAAGRARRWPQPCPDCRGEGRRTEERSYTVDMPPGIDHRNTLRLSGRGAAGPRGGPNGDLYVHVRVAPHPRFTRDGLDLVTSSTCRSPRPRSATTSPSRPSTASRTSSIPRHPDGRVFRLRAAGCRGSTAGPVATSSSRSWSRPRPS
jgi:molecular chaperone DnaJ